MKHFYLKLWAALLLTAVGGAISGLRAQEPAELDQYRIAKIGDAQNTFETGKWYLMGRNPYLVRKGETDGYVYENAIDDGSVDCTNKITNATCTAGNDGDSPTGWSITQTGGSNGVLHVNGHSNANAFIQQKFIEYWVWKGDGATNTKLSDATLSHTEVTLDEAGFYQLTVDARMYSEYGNTPVSGVSFYATTSSGTTQVVLNNAEATEEDGGRGYYGTYTLIVQVGNNKKLNFGFTVAGTNVNWLAIKNVTLTKLAMADATASVANADCSQVTTTDITSSVPNANCKEGSTTALTNWKVDYSEETTPPAVTRQTSARYGTITASATTPYGEYYRNSVFTKLNIITHDLLSVENGLYTVTIEAYVHNGINDGTTNKPIDGISFFADNCLADGTATGGGGYTLLSSGTTTTTTTGTGRQKKTFYGYKGTYTVTCLVTQGTLKIGFYIPEESKCNWLAFRNLTVKRQNLANWTATSGAKGALSRQQDQTRYDLGDTWTGYVGDLYNGGSTLSADTLKHDQVTGLTAGHYQLSVDARMAGIPAVVPEASFSYNHEDAVKENAADNDYGASTIVVDQAAILNAIGAASMEEATVWCVEPDGTRTEGVLGTTDGWRNAEGYFVGWAKNASETGCAFYIQSTDYTTYNIGRHPHVAANVAFYTAKLLYKNNTNGKEAAVYLNLSYSDAAATNRGTFSYTVSSSLGSYYDNKAVAVEQSKIFTAIGVASMSDVTVYYEAPDGTRTVGVQGDTDGWHNAEGYFAYHGSSSYFYLQDSNKTTPDGINYVVGGFPGLTDTPASYTGKLIYRNNSTGAEAMVYITLEYVGLAGITFYAGDQSVDLMTGTQYDGSGYTGYRGTYTLDMSVGKEGTLDFGFQVPAGMWQWFAFQNVQLYRTGELNPLLVDYDGNQPTEGTAISSDDVKKYLVRFIEAGSGEKGTYYNVQFGTAHYIASPISDNSELEPSTKPGKYFVYTGEGFVRATDPAEWKVAEGVFLNSTTDGTKYEYFAQVGEFGGSNLTKAFSTTSGGQWSDLDSPYGNRAFALYPLTLQETNPDVPTFAELNYTGKFYKIRNRATGDYASYSTYTSPLNTYNPGGYVYPDAYLEKNGGFAMITRDAADLTGSSYWWFSKEDGATPTFGAKGVQAVRIHNVMMHDMDYTTPTHTDETLGSTILGITPSGGKTYYLLPTAQEGGTNYWALARTEYTTDKDAWLANTRAQPIIGQKGSMDYEDSYKASEYTQWVLEEATPSEVWAAVKASKRKDMHEDGYFSPKGKTLDGIFTKSDYTTDPTTQAALLSKAQNLGRELYAAATSADLPTLAPEEGGRFYFESYPAAGYYFAKDSEGLKARVGRSADCVWELVPFSDPTMIVRVDQQPPYNDFSSAYYETLTHKPLQRFWLRNRANGAFLTHDPVDKVDDKGTPLEKLSDGIWKMQGMEWQRDNGEWTTWPETHNGLGTVGSLERENADLWYFDVVTNPRTGLRMGVLRTLFDYDYGPWTDTSWDGTLDERGMPAEGHQAYGDAIAGYNLPVVQLDRNAGSIIGGGVTGTDQNRAFSLWVIYDIDTDLPEAGVNYTLWNKQMKQYVYWDKANSKLANTPSVETLATDGDNSLPNQGVWQLTTGSTPHLQNAWAAANSEANKNLLIQSGAALGSTGSAVYFHTSNVDPKGLAISYNEAEAESTNDYYFKAAESGSNAYTKGKSKNDYAVFAINKVDRLYDDVAYELNKMLTNATTKDDMFYLTSGAVGTMNSYVDSWNSFVDAVNDGSVTDAQLKGEYQTYKDIKDLVNGEIGDNSYNMPENNKRYLIKNRETGRYLANQGELVTVDSTDVDYYAVWKFVRGDKKEKENVYRYLYTLENEGARDVMGSLTSTHATGDYRLSFNKDGNTSCFYMGSQEADVSSTKIAGLHFRPDGAGHARLHWYETDDIMDTARVAYGPTLGNRTLESKVVNVSNAYWEVIPVGKFFTNDRAIDKLKSEKALVQQSVRDLATYSGGPLTLEASELYDSEYEYANSLTRLNTAIADVEVGADDGATKLAGLMTTVWTPKQGANPREKYLLTWKPGFPLYLDNAFRTGKGARLTEDSEKAWATTETKDETLAAQAFEFEAVGDKCYLHNHNGKYLAKSNADDAAVEATTATANAAQLTVREVTPGKYSLMDGNNRYLSISEQGDVVWAPVCGYGALWRIKCNDYEQPTIAKVTGESTLWQGNFVNTYVSDYDVQMKVDDTSKVKVFYSLTKDAGGSANTSGSLKIVFKEMVAEDDIYHLQGGQPYLIVKTADAIDSKYISGTRATAANDEMKVWSKHKGSLDLLGKNLMEILPSDYTTEKFAEYYELNYVSPSTQIGSLNGTPVYGTGIGIYPVKVGRALAKGKVVIKPEMLADWIKEYRSTLTSSVKGETDLPGIEIILENEDGSTTSLDDLLLGSEETVLTDGPVYDLNGRKVAESLSDVSRKGVYIVNGQKVLRK